MLYSTPNNGSPHGNPENFLHHREHEVDRMEQFGCHFTVPYKEYSYVFCPNALTMDAGGGVLP